MWRDAHLARSKFTAENFTAAKVASCQVMDSVYQSPSEEQSSEQRWINIVNQVSWFTKPRVSLAYTRNVQDDARRVSREHRDVDTSSQLADSIVWPLFMFSGR